MMLRKGWPLITGLVLLLSLISLSAYTIADEGKAAGLGGRILEAGNDYYRIFIEDDFTTGKLGTYTAGTGPEFDPPFQNILHGAYQPNTNPRTTYVTIRNYTAEKDYVSRVGTPDSNFTVENLNEYGVVTPYPNGFDTDWEVDELAVHQETFVEGSTLTNSVIRVTTKVTNLSTNPVEIGIRYLWDLMVDGNDKSWYRERDPDGDWTKDFKDYPHPVEFGFFETTDDLTTPLFSIYGTVSGKFGLNPPSTEPEHFKYAFWEDGFNNAWDFVVSGTDKDSSVLHYWGFTKATAYKLDPGESVSVTAYLSTQDFPPPSSPNLPTLTEWGGFLLIAALGILLVMKRRAAI